MRSKKPNNSPTEEKSQLTPFFVGFFLPVLPPAGLHLQVESLLRRGRLVLRLRVRDLPNLRSQKMVRKLWQLEIIVGNRREKAEKVNGAVERDKE